MPQYSYRVRDKNNKVFTSSTYSESMNSLAAELEKKGYLILEIKERIDTDDSTNNKSQSRINSKKDFTLSLKSKKEFFSGFYQLYTSGFSLSEVFKSLALNSSCKNVKILCEEIYNKIANGKSIDSALANYKETLGFAYTALIITGEKAGKLEEVLERINSHIKREEKIKSLMISSFTYPLFITSFALGVFFFFEFFLSKLFTSFSSGPLESSVIITLLLVALAKIFCIFLLISGTIYFVVKNKKLSLKVIDLFCEHTFFSNLIKNYNFLNYFSVLSLAYESGMPLADSIPLANSVIKSRKIKGKLTKALFMIMNECEVLTAFKIADVFSEYTLSQIAVGQKTGEFDKVFEQIALDYERNLDESVKFVAKLIGPLIIMIVGIIVCIVSGKAYNDLYSNLLN